MNKRKNKLAALGMIACMSLAALVSPASTLPVQAATSQELGLGVMPLRDAITWIYKVENNKIYKRLYNASTWNWIGDWIYIRDLPTD